MRPIGARPAERKNRIDVVARLRPEPARVLVTGGAGFIGSHLVDHLLADGHSVTIVDSFDDFYAPAIKWRNIAHARRCARFKLVVGDIRDDRMWATLAADRRPDVIVHLAARAGVFPSIAQPATYVDVNVTGTTKVFEFARQARVRRVIFGSSSSVYGNDTPTPFSEGAAASEPISPYAATKRAGELIASTYAHLYGMSVASLRFFTVYGARQRPDLAIHTFARRILDGRILDVYGDGSIRRDFTYIDDIIDGVTRAIEWTARAPGHAAFNLGESQTTSVLELIALLEMALGVPATVRHLPERDGDMRETCADITKARHVLGYAPRTAIAEGLRAFAKWLMPPRWRAVTQRVELRAAR